MTRWKYREFDDNDESRFSQMSESQLRGYIQRNGVDSSSPEEVIRMANKMVKEKFENMRAMPCIETPQGVIYFQYNEKENAIEVGTVTNVGLHVHHTFEYNHSSSLDQNLQDVVEKVEEIYGNIEEEEEHEVEKSRGIHL